MPFGSSTGLDPITQGLDAATQGYVPYYGYGHYAYGHYYGKRSEEYFELFEFIIIIEYQFLKVC